MQMQAGPEMKEHINCAFLLCWVLLSHIFIKANGQWWTKAEVV